MLKCFSAATIERKKAEATNKKGETLKINMFQNGSIQIKCNFKS